VTSGQIFGMEGVQDIWYEDVPDPQLSVLLPAALRALHAEDRILAAAFDAAPRSDRWRDTNHGLGYWLFETTLVYTIFKAWIPIAETQWEAPFATKDDRRRWADLVVFDGQRARLVFEAKWWMTNAVRPSLVSDLNKLREWREVDRRMMLCFWRSPRSAEQWERDIGDVRTFCKHQGEALIYAGAFPTDEHRTRDARGSYFAMAVIDAREPTR